MAYDIQFESTDDADWGVAMPLIDGTTNQPLDTTDITFELEVSCGGSTYLTATTEDDTIEVPETGTIQWLFTKEQMASLDTSRTYRVGCRMINAGGTTQLFVGSLAVLDGGFA